MGVRAVVFLHLYQICVEINFTLFVKEIYDFFILVSRVLTSSLKVQTASSSGTCNTRLLDT